MHGFHFGCGIDHQKVLPLISQLQKSLTDLSVVSVPLGLHSVELPVQTRRGGLNIHVQDYGQVGPDSLKTVSSNSYNIVGAETTGAALIGTRAR